MGFLLNIFDKLAEDEDNVLMKQLNKDYWILPQASMLFPSWKRSAIPLSIGLLLFHSIMLGVHFIILVYSIPLALHEGNLELLGLQVHYAILLFFGMFLLFFFNYIRKENALQHRCLARDIGIYRSGRIYSEKWCVEMKKESRMQLFYLMLIPGTVGLTGSVVVGVPYLQNWYKGMEQPYTHSGINVNLPIPAWYPFSTHEGILHFVALSGQLMGCGSLAIVFITALFMQANFTTQLCNEFAVLGYGLDTLFRRSLTVYHRQHSEKEGMEVDYMDPNFQRIICLSLRDTLVHHQAVSEMVSLYKMEVSPAAAGAYMTGMIVIGICLYNILVALDTHDYGAIVTFVLMIMAETLTMFLISLLGAMITAKSESVRDKLYFTEWDNMDVRNRRVILNFQTAITEPVVVKAAGIIDMSMGTFSSLMNSAYSFFNIMNGQ